MRSEVPCILIIISHLIVCSSLCHQVSQQYTWAMRSRDKTPMTKRQHRKLQYKKCYPQPQNPKDKKISGISYIGILSVVFRPNSELCMTAEALLNEMNSCSIQLLSLTVNVRSTCYLAFSRPMLLSMA